VRSMNRGALDDRTLLDAGANAQLPSAAGATLELDPKQPS
jgi:hypothetical protein